MVPLMIPVLPVNAADQDVIKLRIMETTDTHTNLLSYDYYKGVTSDKVGLIKTAELVKQARKESQNTVLVDNGDTIQGTPLGTYTAKVNPLKKGQVHPVIKIMNEMGYDMATLGNHEFNYGLDYLDELYNDANFSYVSANVYIDDKDQNPNNDKNKFTPYKILEKKVRDESGKEQTIKIGYLGLVTPQIMDWDKANLEGEVITKDIVATAEKFVPEMREKGADLVIVMAHSGFNSSAEANKGAEDAIYPLTKVKGIDALTFSHTHKVFPAADIKSLDALFKDKDGKLLSGVDNEKGTINGVPAVQAGYGGEKLGLIDLDIQKVDGKWKVVQSQSSTKQIYDATTQKPTVEADSKLVNLIKQDHEATINYTMGKLGTTTAPIHSYFALVQDDPSVQVVTAAQKWYAEKYIKLNAPQYKNVPILSVGAPFKAGRNGVDEFTEIKKGDLTIRSAGDLYLYDNTLKAILAKGSVVKEWLEMSAGKFNKIDPNKTEAQALLDPSFQVFNFDVIDGVTYQVDVTKTAKYKADGTVNDANSSRIFNLKYNGKALDLKQDFIVVTNNYRAGGGGNFPGIKGSKYIIDSADENRQILMDYISEVEEINPSIDNNWSISPINDKVKVTFTSNPKAEEYAKDTKNITYTGKKDDKGFGIFTIDLSANQGENPEPPEETIHFTDVPTNHWAKAYIDYLVNKKIISGKSNTIFAPEEQITRGQFVAMLVRSLGLSTENATVRKDIETAYKNGLTTMPPAKFGANKVITREQMAYMIVRAYEKKIGEPYKAKKDAAFNDRNKISKNFIPSINAANELGFIRGYKNGTFDPKGATTRAQAAKVVSEFVKK
nr:MULTISPECIES: bifunctional 2',3'-cyclic-nucleotide 2'-phosphodiesterase/3'-nucleotidase [Bacillus]